MNIHRPKDPRPGVEQAQAEMKTLLSPQITEAIKSVYPNAEKIEIGYLGVSSVEITGYMEGITSTTAIQLNVSFELNGTTK